MSSITRITGLATGLDVDDLVSKLMKAENTRLDKLKQDRQLLEWKQELYRDIIGDLNIFKSTFFDVLKSDTYMLSSRNYSSFDIKSSDVANSITAIATAGTIAGEYKISVAQLAEKAKVQGMNYINIKESANPITFPVKIDDTNKQLSVDGRTITLTNGVYKDLSSLAAEVNKQLAATSNGSGGHLNDNVKAVVRDNNIYFLNKIDITANTELKVSVAGNDYSVKISNAGKYTMDDIAAQLNSQLKGSKSTDGSTTFPSGVTATFSSDGTKIIFNDKDGASVTGIVSYKAGAEVVANVAAVQSTGSDTLTASVPSTSDNILSYKKAILSGVNDTLTIKIGSGSPIDITLHDDNFDAMSDTEILNALVQDIKAQLTSDMKLDVTVDSLTNRIKFISTSQSQVYISGNATGTLGIPANFEVNQTIYDKMSNIVSGEVKFTVNNQTFHYDFSSSTDDDTDPNDKIIGAKGKTISDILNDISSKANVSITYSELTRQFVLTSKSTGANQVITNTKDLSGSFISTLFGQTEVADASGKHQDADGTWTVLKGKDAEIIITEPGSSGVWIQKPTNNFTVDGINYVLNSKPAGEVTLTLTPNAQNTFDKIKAFIDKYNELIEKINDKLTEKKQYDYLPLTDDQKKEMKDTDIANWEAKAKQGILSRDSTLEKMLSDMRMAFYDKVDGAGTYLTDIGLSTSSDTTERGKIIIDEDKLKKAIQDNPDKVANLFMKQSGTAYNPDSKSSLRYKSEGIFQRLNDILQDNIRTTRDSKGNKGLLLQKAGIKGDYSEYNNILTDELNEQDKRINEMIDKLYVKEEKYYLDFSKLETVMQQLNQQSSWLAQQLGMN